jgi:hypothetical protein
MGASALTAQAADTAPPADPQGCHGYWTVQYKQSQGDAGATGSAIGGVGNNSEGDKSGQAHSDLGRGQTLQQFLAEKCDGLGSQK